MTREDAIAYGNRVIDLGLNDETQAFCEAAIEALKQEPTTTVLQEIREEIRKDAEWWSEHDSLREQVLRDVIEDIIDKHIGDTE